MFLITNIFVACAYRTFNVFIFRIPSGVLNVLPIDQEQFKIERNSIFIKLIFTGSYEKAALYFKLSGEGHTPCEVLVPRRPTIIVYETADLYAAADGVFEAFCFHDTRVCFFNF